MTGGLLPSSQCRQEVDMASGVHFGRMKSNCFISCLISSLLLAGVASASANNVSSTGKIQRASAKGSVRNSASQRDSHAGSYAQSTSNNYNAYEAPVGTAYHGSATYVADASKNIAADSYAAPAGVSAGPYGVPDAGSSYTYGGYPASPQSSHYGQDAGPSYKYKYHIYPIDHNHHDHHHNPTGTGGGWGSEAPPTGTDGWGAEPDYGDEGWNSEGDKGGKDGVGLAGLLGLAGLKGLLPLAAILPLLLLPLLLFIPLPFIYFPPGTLDATNGVLKLGRSMEKSTILSLEEKLMKSMVQMRKTVVDNFDKYAAAKGTNQCIERVSCELFRAAHRFKADQLLDSALRKVFRSGSETLMSAATSKQSGDCSVFPCVPFFKDVINN